MANPYADRPTLKLALKITDTDRDSLLDQALATASRMIDTDTGREPDGFTADTSATARTFNPRRRLVCDRDGERFLVDEISSTSGLVVEVGSGTSFTTITDYETEPENAIARGEPISSLLRVGGYWESAPQTRLRVTAKWGWPSVPDQIVQATLIQASRLYKRKDSPEGVLGSAEWGTVRLAGVDPDVKKLIRPYLLDGFA